MVIGDEVGMAFIIVSQSGGTRNTTTKSGALANLGTKESSQSQHYFSLLIEVANSNLSMVRFGLICRYLIALTIKYEKKLLGT